MSRFGKGHVAAAHTPFRRHACDLQICELKTLSPGVAVTDLTSRKGKKAGASRRVGEQMRRDILRHRDGFGTSDAHPHAITFAC